MTASLKHQFNFFISSNGVLYTPPLSEGCVGGIMRIQVINLAISNGMLVYENPIHIQHLLSADEIITTNAINGIRWVGQYKDKDTIIVLLKNLLIY